MHNSGAACRENEMSYLVSDMIEIELGPRLVNVFGCPNRWRTIDAVDRSAAGGAGARTPRR